MISCSTDFIPSHLNCKETNQTERKSPNTTRFIKKASNQLSTLDKTSTQPTTNMAANTYFVLPAFPPGRLQSLFCPSLLHRKTWPSLRLDFAAPYCVGNALTRSTYNLHRTMCDCASLDMTYKHTLPIRQSRI